MRRTCLSAPRFVLWLILDFIGLGFGHVCLFPWFQSDLSLGIIIAVGLVNTSISIINIIFLCITIILIFIVIFIIIIIIATGRLRFQAFGYNIFTFVLSHALFSGEVTTVIRLS